MIRYYCSGFDNNNAFGHGMSDMFKQELKNTNSIVYIPTGEKGTKKAISKYIPIYNEHFKNVGIIFDKVNIITPNINSNDAKEMIKNASFIMLMGGNPFSQKEMCEKLNIIEDLKRYDGVMLGYSAGAMLMSKNIIITPCSDAYPNFQIEEGLNLDNISIYPHNNTSLVDYPETLIVDEETYQKEDLIKVANTYGDYYLLQDYLREDGLYDVSYIKSNNGNIEFYTENNGKIWIASNDIKLMNNKRR